MKKLSILLVCCLLVSCSSKLEETSTPSIEETTHPTTIIETTTETTVNEDIIRLESEVAELESKVSELESKLAETSVEKIVEETTKETKQPKETVVVVVTATPTPTENTPSPIEPKETIQPTETHIELPKDVYVTVNAHEGRISASEKIINALRESGYQIGNMIDVTAGVIPGPSQLEMDPGSYILDLGEVKVHITVTE